jgi:hypothetical protein
MAKTPSATRKKKRVVDQNNEILEYPAKAMINIGFNSGSGLVALTFMSEYEDEEPLTITIRADSLASIFTQEALKELPITFR